MFTRHPINFARVIFRSCAITTLHFPSINCLDFFASATLTRDFGRPFSASQYFLGLLISLASAAGSHFLSYPIPTLLTTTHTHTFKHIQCNTLSLCATTSSYLTQVSHSTLPSYSHITTTGSSSFPKVISYLFALRTPLSLSMPKSGNVCGRHYIVSIDWSHLLLFELPKHDSCKTLL